MTSDHAKKLALRAQSAERNPWFRALGASPLLLLPVLVTLAAVANRPEFLWFCLHAIVLAAGLSTYLYKRNPWPRLRASEVRVDEGSLWVDDVRYARSSFRNAYLVPQKGCTLVRLVRGRLQRDVEVRVPDRERGQQLLRALGLGVDQTVGSFRVMSRAHASFGRSLLATFGPIVAGGLLMGSLSTLSPPLAPLGGLVTLATLFTLMFARSKVDIGADGVLVRWLRRERYVSYEEIVAVESRVRGFGSNAVDMVDLRLRNGEIYSIPVSQRQWRTDLAAGLRSRIEASLQQHRRNEPVQPAALVVRGNDSPLDWVRRLRATMERASHRQGAIDVQALWRTIEDHASRSLDRASAAIALGSSLSSDDRRRLVRIAEAVASPKLRIALEGVAHEEQDEQLADALQGLEEEAQAAEAAS